MGLQTGGLRNGGLRNLTEISAIPDSVVAQSNLIAWYPFENSATDETSGDSNFGDTSDYSGTVSGATEQSSGGVVDILTQSVDSVVFSFDGTDDYLTMPSGIYNWENESFSVSFWANPDTLQNSWVVSIMGTDWKVQTADDGSIKFNIVDKNINFPSAETTYSSNTYQFFVVTSDAASGDIQIAKDGAVQDTTSTPGVRFVQNDIFSVGRRRDNNSNHFDGLIDDVRIYNKKLTATEISDIYNATKP
jgi:hypothetical protein